RRAADDLAGLRLERQQLAVELLDLLLALLALAFDALAAGTRLGGGRRQLLQPHLGGFELGIARFVDLKRLLLEIRGERRRAGERPGLCLEPRQRLLGLPAQDLFALQIVAELLGAGLELLAAIGSALGLALQ